MGESKGVYLNKEGLEALNRIRRYFAVFSLKASDSNLIRAALLHYDESLQAGKVKSPES